MSERVFLFLQSHPSFFGRGLVKEMRTRGEQCRVINLSLGDWFFRLGIGAENYTGKLENWRSWLKDYLLEHAVTDIIYYADQRPYHRIARSLGHEMGIQTFAYEFGYLRPDWITLERGGMGPFSHFPDDSNLIREIAPAVDIRDNEGHYPYPFLFEATFEVIYHVGPVFFPFLFRHYQNDRYYHPLFDFPSYIPRLLRNRRMKKYADSVIDRLVENGRKFFVVPMQLQSDYQIRRSSPYSHMSEMVEQIVRSFEAGAAPDSELVFKIHPYDNNIEKWPKVIRKIARKHGLESRTSVIDGGDLFKLVRNSAGVVLINSTTGITVLEYEIPLKVLGIAIFDVAGMTHQGSLDDFWHNPEKPDKELTELYLRLLKASVQVKGNFFTRAGRAVAVREFADRLIANDVNSYGAYLPTPPRLERAKKMGVPIVYEDLKYDMG